MVWVLGHIIAERHVEETIYNISFEWESVIVWWVASEVSSVVNSVTVDDVVVIMQTFENFGGGAWAAMAFDVLGNISDISVPAWWTTEFATYYKVFDVDTRFYWCRIRIKYTKSLLYSGCFFFAVSAYTTTPIMKNSTKNHWLLLRNRSISNWLSFTNKPQRNKITFCLLLPSIFFRLQTFLLYNLLFSFIH